MKIYEIEQQGDDWFNIRKGKMTASHAQAIGSCGKGLDTYILELMAEYYSSGEKEHYSNFHTERGIELEPLAKDMYELTKGVEVREVGFCEYNEYVGCSPDGLVGEDGGIEIKSVSDKNHFSMILNGEKNIESKYIWQIQMNLYITGRKWWDYISYNPNFKDSLLVYRIYPDEKKFEKLKEGIDIGIAKIKEINKKISNDL